MSSKLQKSQMKIHMRGSEKKELMPEQCYEKNVQMKIMSLHSYFSNLFFFNLNSRNGVEIPVDCHNGSAVSV